MRIRFRCLRVAAVISLLDFAAIWFCAGIDGFPLNVPLPGQRSMLGRSQQLDQIRRDRAMLTVLEASVTMAAAGGIGILLLRGSGRIREQSPSL